MNLDWLKLVEQIAPIVLANTPLAPIAPHVSAGIQLAEQIPGANGAAKLDIAKQITNVAVNAVNTQAGSQKIDPVAVDSAFTQSVHAVVAATNLIDSFKNKGQ